MSAEQVETKRPKYIEPYRCPRCGSRKYKELHTRDGSDSVGYDCRCLTCGQEYTLWESITYEPTGIEIDGITHEIEQQDDALQAAIREGVALAAYGRLKILCGDICAELGQRILFSRDGNEQCFLREIADRIATEMEIAAKDVSDSDVKRATETMSNGLLADAQQAEPTKDMVAAMEIDELTEYADKHGIKYDPVITWVEESWDTFPQKEQELRDAVIGHMEKGGHL